MTSTRISMFLLVDSSSSTLQIYESVGSRLHALLQLVCFGRFESSLEMGSSIRNADSLEFFTLDEPSSQPRQPTTTKNPSTNDRHLEDHTSS